MNCKSLIVGLLLFCCFGSYGQFYNGIDLTFGKNRIQYKDDFWSFYNYQNYDIYFSDEGKNLADYVAINAHINLLEIQRFFEYELKQKIDFVIYNTQDLSRTSNIGNIAESPEGGYDEIRTINNKVFLYFNGDHEDFDYQIRKGIASILINDILYGDGDSRMIKNSALLYLPNWYFDGLVRFVAETWTNETDNEMRKLIYKKPKLKISQLKGEEAAIAGQSTWYYIADQFGKNVIPRIVYITRSSRSLESGYGYVLGLNSNDFLREWRLNVNEYYEKDNLSFTDPIGELAIKKHRKNKTYLAPKLSPKGTHLAYVTNKFSQQKVYIVNQETNKKKKLLRLGHKIDIPADYSFPVLAWHPSNTLLSMFYEKENEIIWLIYNVADDEFIESKLPFLDKITSASYSKDGKKIIFIGVDKGKSDVYVFDVQSRASNKITDDYFDEYSADFVGHNNKWIVFSSNRNEDSLSLNGKINKVFPKSTNLYLVNYENGKDKSKNTQYDYLQLTKHSLAKYSEIAAAKKGEFYFISDYNGVKNIFNGQIDSAIDYVDTTIHYKYFINQFPITNVAYSVNDINFSNNHLTYQIEAVKRKSNLYQIAQEKISYQPQNFSDFRKNFFIDYQYDSSLKPANETSKIITLDSIKQRMQIDPSFVDYRYYVFEDELRVNAEDSLVTVTDRGYNNFSPLDFKALPQSDSSAILAKLRNYEIEFKTYEAGLDLSNQYLNPSYQRYTGTGGNLIPGLSGLTKYGIIDLLENHKIVGGFRVNDIGNNEAFITYYNYKKRWDKQYLFYRGASTDLANDIGTKTITYEFLYRISYPFSMVDRVQLTFSTRFDEFIPLSFNEQFLTTPIQNEITPNIRAAYVFDNTRNLGLNLKTGTRLQIFSEFYLNATSPNLYITTFGGDIRQYVPIHKNIVWASRLGFGTSLGTQRLMYYLGGVDSWLFGRFNNDLAPSELPKNSEYTYQTMATNMRGFRQNIRNGPAFSVINTEIRWPIISYFYPKPIHNNFLKNFQVIGFSDLGTAWGGFSPFSDENSFNTQNFVIGGESNPIGRVEVKTRKQPLVLGYGFGIRSELLGYFLKLDWAWGLGDGNTEDRLLLFSLGYDF